MRKITIVVAILIVASLVIGYWAIIGFASPIPDATDNVPDSDGDGGNVNPNYHWYATLNIGFHIVSLGGDGLEMDAYQGEIDFVIPTVNGYLSWTQGRMYETQKLLRGHGGHESGIYGDCWVSVKVTGPGGYIGNWKSAELVVGGYYVQVPQTEILDTGRFFMAEAGTYQMKITLDAQSDSGGSFYEVDSILRSLVVG